MEGMELISFQIIASVGTARSYFIEAIQKARKGDFDGAQEAIENGEKEFITAHQAHGELITNEASGNKTEVSLLLMHAEDQLMSAETIKIIAEEMIELCKKVVA